MFVLLGFRLLLHIFCFSVCFFFVSGTHSLKHLRNESIWRKPSEYDTIGFEWGRVDFHISLSILRFLLHTTSTQHEISFNIFFLCGKSVTKNVIVYPTVDVWLCIYWPLFPLIHSQSHPFFTVFFVVTLEIWFLIWIGSRWTHSHTHTSTYMCIYIQKALIVMWVSIG